MRTLVHLSDLHFGRIDYALITPLITLIKQIGPDVVVVSGDLTQRARSAQFKEARLFLDALPQPQIVIPGNHDIPLHNIFNRFVRPLDKYQRYITDDLEPGFVDDEIAVFGINTARSMTVKNGRISHAQMMRVKARLNALGDHITKIIVTHHPFDLPGHYDKKNLVGRAPIAMGVFSGCRTDLLPAGHLHASHAGNTSVRYPIADYSALVVQAGTATSTRGRGESNSFNIIRIDPLRIDIERYSWVPECEIFVHATTETFERISSEWTRLD